MLHKKMAMLFNPYWNRDQRAKLNCVSVVLSNFLLQALVYVGTAPNTGEQTQSDSDSYKAVFIPMFNVVAQILILVRFQSELIAAQQESIAQRLFVAKQQDSGSKHLGLLQTLADEQLSKDIQEIGTHIDGAVQICNITASISNVIPMCFYWRAAYIILPQARALLWISTAFTVAVIIAMNRLNNVFTKAQANIMQQDSEWQARMAQNIRYNDAVIAGAYQQAEKSALDIIIHNKQSSLVKHSSYLGAMIACNLLLEMTLLNLLRMAVGSFYPELKGTQNLDTFNLQMNLFASTINAAVHAITTNYSRAMIGLEKLYVVDQAIKQVDDLAAKPLLRLKYAQQLENSKALVKFENFTLAIPRELDLKQYSSFKERISAVLSGNDASFVFDTQNFEFAASDLRRIYGASGIGKSTFFRAMHGIWPYASGTIRFACNRDEIYSLTQEQMFVKGTLLQNIFYPDPVPRDFHCSEQERQLHATMRLIGLSQEIARLDQDKDWSAPDLSPGLKKRFNFLRMYISIIFGNHPKPKVILLDEMTSGVDGDNAAFLEGLVRKLRRDFPQVLVLFIKHNEEQHPQQFCSEQQDFVAMDPQFARGLNDCENVKLTSNKRNETFLHSFEAGKDKPEDIDVEEGVRLLHGISLRKR